MLGQNVAVVDGCACHRPLLDLSWVVVHTAIAIYSHILSTFEDVFNLKRLNDLVLIWGYSPSRRLLRHFNPLELASTTGCS